MPGRKEKGEQMDLIDVGPENEDEIHSHIELYKKAQKERIAALKTEVKEKEIIKKLVLDSNLTRLEKGEIKLRCRKFTIIIEPRDELVKIQEIKIKGKGRGRPPKESPDKKPDQGPKTATKNQRRQRTVKQSMDRTVAATENDAA